MKLGSCFYHNQTYVFIDQGNHYVLPALDPNFDQIIWHDMQRLIEQAPNLAKALQSITPIMQVKPQAVTLLAPIPRPRKNIMCLGLNYLEHAEETAEHVGRSAKKPQYPIVFTKATSSVTAHEADIPFDPETCSQLDWEAELGIIIGKGGHKISEENALQHIFGYTVINDLSARDLQHHHKQFFLGKSLDGACPIGPHIVTADDIPEPHALNIACRVNGISKQASNTRMMLFNIAEIIATLSRSMTLESGDIIATGTPSGVGFVRQPPEFLHPGDVVECEIEKIGVLRNRIAQPS
ncbi:MAG: 5-carboxymethyl-2-hydroxymuconate isomerase [Proteobacteria bacterium]|nr:MAG: 5-carboxymethyl-2-hydroxymuconate isomerase [Pseudomonadota bacterium]